MTTTATRPVSASAASAGAFRFGPCFIDRQGTSLKILAIEGCYCFGRILILGHFNKAKAAGFSGVAVCHDFNLLDFSELTEEGP